VELFYKEAFHIPNFTFVNKPAIDCMLQKQLDLAMINKKTEVKPVQ
jgi:hypothetical protein